jgi:hypothetical protein
MIHLLFYLFQCWLTVRHSWWNLFFSLMWASVTVAIAAFVRANGRMFCNRPRLHKPRRWWRYKIFSNRTIHLQVIGCFLHHFLSSNLVWHFSFLFLLICSFFFYFLDDWGFLVGSSPYGHSGTVNWVWVSPQMLLCCTECLPW